MDKWLERVGGKIPTNSFQQDVMLLLKQNAKFEKYTSKIEWDNLSIAQIALLAYLANDGVIIMTQLDKEKSEAVHLQHCIPDDELETMFESASLSLGEELKMFEKQLTELTVDDTGD